MVKPKTKARCKICGYLVSEADLEKMKAVGEAQAAEAKKAKEAGDAERAKKITAAAPVCPACGVSYKLFEIYEDPVEPDRRAFLSLDLHPVIVHAPQALTFLMLLLGAATFFLAGDWAKTVWSTLQVMSLLLPITIVGAIVSGIIDAKYRFKRHDTPILTHKKVLGIIYLVASCLMAYHYTAAGFSVWVQSLTMVLNVVAMAISAKLGIIGAHLIQAIFVKMAPPKKDAPAKPAAEKTE